MLQLDTHEVPLPQIPEFSGLQVFPSADLLPANLLRFHLRFSQPVDVFDVNEHLRLIDTSEMTNRIVAHPFLDLNEGLWSNDGLTLTVMLHPGRLKTGLASQAALGSAMRSTRSYKLQVQGKFEAYEFVAESGEWLTLKRFSVHDAIHDRVDANSFMVDLPRIGSQTALTIETGRVIDQLAIENLVAVTDERNTIVAVDFATSDSGTAIVLTPKTKWQAGDYSIYFASEFEDVCGNRFGVAFEEEGSSQLREETTRLIVSIPNNNH